MKSLTILFCFSFTYVMPVSLPLAVSLLLVVFSRPSIFPFPSCQLYLLLAAFLSVMRFFPPCRSLSLPLYTSFSPRRLSPFRGPVSLAVSVSLSFTPSLAILFLLTLSRFLSDSLSLPYYFFFYEYEGCRFVA